MGLDSGTPGRCAAKPAAGPGRQRNCIVFLGSRSGAHAEYREATAAFGRALAARGLNLVYGGGSIGLMGTVAEAALEAGAEVRGVITQSLADKEVAHRGLTQLHIVKNMHERKKAIFDMGDMVAALPGGIGTLEELLELLTWAQLEIHDKPVGVLNTRGFYDPFISMLERIVSEGFMKPEFMSYIVVGKDPDELVDKLLSFKPQRVSKL